MYLIAIACLRGLGVAPCGPAGGVATGVVEFNAVYRAYGQAQLAAGAGVRNDGVHALVGAQDGVCRAGFDAQRAAYAPVFINTG